MNPRFVWCDLETTGLNPQIDTILALGLIITEADLSEVARFERVAHVPAWRDCLMHMRPEVREMHEKSGLLERVEREQAGLAFVEREAAWFLDTHLGAPKPSISDRPVMAGNSVHFDRSFLTLHCPSLVARFHYRLLDVSSFKVLATATIPGAKEWNDSQPAAAHTPISDLEGSISELRHWRKLFHEVAP